ncbi:MAG: FIST N-terminal domain-containing protein [Xanthobacteraceae bacterium]
MRARSSILSGQSDLEDPLAALNAAIGRGHASPALILVFSSSERDRERTATALRERFPRGLVVGCTSGGGIHFGGYKDGAITVISFADTDCVAAAERLDGMADARLKDGHDLAQRALSSLSAKGVNADPGSCFAITLLDSRYGNEDKLISGIRSGLGDIPLFGGGACDGLLQVNPAIYHDLAFRADCAVLVLVHLRRHFKVFSTHHYLPLDKELAVTCADVQRRVIERINGRNAGQEYADLLGVNLSSLHDPNACLTPLMVKVGSNHFTRGIASIDEYGHLHMAGPVPTGLPLSLAKAVGMAESLRGLEYDIQDELGEAELILGADCLMRRIEAESTGQAEDMAAWFRRNKVVGFCSFGEQFRSMHLNNTFTGVAIGPRRSQTSRQPITSRTGGATARPKEENERLKRVVDALHRQVDEALDNSSDTFGLFQNAVLMEEMIERRTEELADANRKLQAELVRRRRTEDALRQARQEAIKANQSKTQFVAGVSHDMQQPLNAARLLLGRLEHELLSSSGAKALLQMNDSLQTLETMLTDFFDISKLDAGGYVVNPRTFALEPMFRELLREFDPLATSHRLVLRSVRTSALVRTDKVMLQRVLRNLISNALRYTPEGRVVVGVRRCQKQVRVFVIDTGVGLSEEALREVFRPYFQLNNPASVVQRGSGFGLAVVERICTLLGTRIKVRSTVGRGTSFSLALPQGRAEDLLGPEAVSPLVAPLWGRRVLVIEDDAAGREGLLALLEVWGCEVLAANGAEEADALLSQAERPPDLIISDLHLGLGKSNGLTVATDLLARGMIGGPAIIVSSDPDPALRRLVQDAGALFVPKPIRPARLRATLSNALKMRDCLQRE